jgi:hypothetical protein
MRVSRDIGQASDEQLAGMRDALRRLLAYERHIAGELLTTLHKLNESIGDAQIRREAGGHAQPAHMRAPAAGWVSSDQTSHARTMA